MTKHTDKLREILSRSLQNTKMQYSARLQEQCVADLVELVPHLPEQAEQIIRAATNISDELCNKCHFKNAFRTAGYILAQVDDLPNTGMLCAKATQTLINSAMDAREYETAFKEIYKFMYTGVVKQIPEMFDFGANAMKAALDDCAQNPNFPKLKAAKIAAWSVAKDNSDYQHLETIARIAEQQSQPAFAIECYADIANIAELYHSPPSSYRNFFSPLNIFLSPPKKALNRARSLFRSPGETCNIYADPNIESAAHKLAAQCPPQLVYDIRDALRDHGHNALALSIANSHLRHRVNELEHLNKEEVQNMIELASESLCQLQSEMREHGHLSPQSTKLCIEVAASCGLVMKVQQSFPQNVLDAKGLDVAPYQALDMLFDSRPEGKIDLLSIATAASAYPVNDAYAKNIHELCSDIRPKNSSGDYILDTTTAAFKDVLIDYAGKFYDEAATENVLRDFNRVMNSAKKPLLPEGYRSLVPGVRQKVERSPE